VDCWCAKKEFGLCNHIHLACRFPQQWSILCDWSYVQEASLMVNVLTVCCEFVSTTLALTFERHQARHVHIYRYTMLTITDYLSVRHYK